MSGAADRMVDRADRGGPLLAARGLCVTFARDGLPINALSDFALEVHAGEVLGLMGEPGSGKSTAALALTGLVRSGGRLTRGTVLYRGRDILTLSAEQQRKLRGRHIGFISQTPRAALHPMLTVGEQLVNVYRAHHEDDVRGARAAAQSLLASVGINDPARRLGAYPHELSTGMAQRVVMAIALAGAPELLIADEPTSGLDVTIQAQLLDRLWSTARTTGSAVVLVTQDLGIVANYCDRVCVMHGGTVVASQSVVDFFTRPDHPYSRHILALQGTDPGAGDGDRMPAAQSQEAAHEATLLEVGDLVKTFPLPRTSQRVHAVDRLSFKISRAETLGLVGESGSGKTTVGRTLLHLEPPSGGDIRFRGRALNELTEAQLRPLRPRMQIVFQDPMDSMDPRWSVERVIQEPLRLTGLSASARAARTDELLDAVGLPRALRTHRPRELSAGQQQRVGIARAMATRPDFVVLDEPTSALTPETTAEILRLLRRLQIETGVSYLFISHDLAIVRYLCHRLAVLYLGQVVETGTKEQIFATPRHPYTQALLAAHLYPDLETRRVDRPQRVTLTGEIPSPVDLPRGCYLYGRCPLQQARCRAEPQALTAIADGRAVRCWRVVEGEI